MSLTLPTRLFYIPSRMTVSFSEDNVCTECVQSASNYTIFSHVWGKFEKYESRSLNLKGIPWKIPFSHKNKVNKILKGLESYTTWENSNKNNLGQPEKVSLIWMDVLCIDQSEGSNDHKRELPKMSSYYRNAKKCIVWLEHSELSVSLHPVNLLFSIFNNNKMILADRDNPPDNSVVDQVEKYYWDILNVFNLNDDFSWFCRVWTYQECCLSKVMVFLSSNDLSFCNRNELLLIAEALYLGSIGPTRFQPTLYKYQGNVHWGLYCLWDAQMALNYPGTFTLSFSDANFSMRVRKCSFSQDYIYGTLGVIKLKPNKFPEINYDLSLQDILLRTSKCMEGNCIAKLLYAYWNVDSKIVRTLSWLPPVLPEDGCLFRTDDNIYAGASFVSEGDEDDNRLLVKGLECSDCVYLGLFKNYKMHLEPKFVRYVEVRISDCENFAKTGPAIMGTADCKHGGKVWWATMQDLSNIELSTTSLHLHIISSFIRAHPGNVDQFWGALLTTVKNEVHEKLAHCYVFGENLKSFDTGYNVSDFAAIELK